MTTKSLADYDRAIQLNPNNANAYVNRGVAKYALGRKKEALADYNRAIKLDSNHTFAYFGRGVAKCALGRNQEAIADYDRAIQREHLSYAMSRNTQRASMREYDKR